MVRSVIVRWLARTGVALVVVGTYSAPAFAQLGSGSYYWQQQPYCNVITLNVQWTGTGYTLDGWDDQCGTVQRAPVVGTGTLNPDGTIGFGMAVVTTPGGRALHIDAALNATTYSGTWRDSSGNTGTFMYASATGGSSRPVPTIPTSALATGAVTSTTIANNTIGAIDVKSSEIQRRLVGVCAAGTFFQSVSETGTVTCTGGTASNSTALGAAALGVLSTGYWNTAVGNDALKASTTGYYNTAVGAGALDLAPGGNNNTAVGTYALRRNTGRLNVAVGGDTLKNSTTAEGNVAVGYSTMSSATTGSWNTGAGHGVLLAATSAANTVALGNNALFRLTTGNDNVAVGSLTMTSVTTTSNNVAVGRAALQNTTGSANTALGDRAGLAVGTGSNNVHIAHQGTSTDSAFIRIGTPGTQTRAYVAGVRGVTTMTAAIPVLVSTEGQLGTTSSSRRFKQDIADMDEFSARLARLRPVTFRYTQLAADGTKPLDFGLVAEEVAEVFPELAVRAGDGQIETVAYHKLPALLLNELQKQQRIIDALRERVAALETSREQR